MHDNKILKGDWDDINILVRQTWSKLTDEDLNQIKINPFKIYPYLRSYYGYSMEQAEKAVDTFNLMVTGEEYQL